VTFWCERIGLIGAGTWQGAGRLEALSTDDEHHMLAARALELEHPVQDAGEQLTAIAAQLAVGRRVEVDLLQGGVHGRCLSVAGSGCAGYRLMVTRVSRFSGQLHPPQPELHADGVFLPRKRASNRTVASPTMAQTMMVSMVIPSIK
jgi:hypothetical protein